MVLVIGTTRADDCSKVPRHSSAFGGRSRRVVRHHPAPSSSFRRADPGSTPQRPPLRRSPAPGPGRGARRDRPLGSRPRQALRSARQAGGPRRRHRGDPPDPYGGAHRPREGSPGNERARPRAVALPLPPLGASDLALGREGLGAQGLAGRGPGLCGVPPRPVSRSIVQRAIAGSAPCCSIPTSATTSCGLDCCRPCRRRSCTRTSPTWRTGRGATAGPASSRPPSGTPVLGALVDLSDALVFVVAVVAIPNLIGLYVMAPLVKRELARRGPEGSSCAKRSRRRRLAGQESATADTPAGRPAGATRRRATRPRAREPRPGEGPAPASARRSPCSSGCR